MDLRLTLFCLLSVVGLHAKASRDRPRNVTAEAVNTTSIIVSWDAPRTHRRCDVSRYIVRYKHDANPESLADRVSGNQTSMYIHNLVPDTRYYVRLVAVGCRGKSQPTKWVKVKTNEAVMGDDVHRKVENKLPGKPSAVRTRTLTDSIILMWEPPDDNILVRGYMVGYGEGVPDVNWQYISDDLREFTIKNLKHSTQYVISLRAFNNFGKGPVVYDLIYTREEDAPTAGPLAAPIALKSRVLSPSTVWLQWTDPSLGRTQKITDERYYVVNYSPVPQGKSKTVTVKALNCVIYELRPGTTYEFMVKTKKGDEETPHGIGVYNTTFESAPLSPPRNLRVLPTNSSTEVRVTWEPSKRPNGAVTGYLVFYTTDAHAPDKDWDIEGVLGNIFHAPVRDLTTDTVYYFKAQVRNSKGYGPFSKVVEFHVGKPAPKVKKETSQVENITSLSVEVDTEHDINEDDISEDHVTTTAATPTSVAPDEPDAAVARQTLPEALVGNASLLETEPEVDRTQPKESLMQSVQFHTIIRHKVSAVLTWSGESWYDASAHGHYTLTYFRSDGPQKKWTRNSKIPLFIIDDLDPEQLYTYEVVRISHTSHKIWARSGIIDTSV